MVYQGKYLTKKMRLVLVYSFYSVRRDKNRGNSEQDMIKSSDVTRTRKTMAILMKQEARGDIYCLLVQFATCYKPICSILLEVTRTNEDAGECFSSERDKKDEPKTLVLEALFEAERTALPYIGAAETYRQPALLLRLIYSAMKETAVHFWQTGEMWEEIILHLNCKRHGKALKEYYKLSVLGKREHQHAASTPQQAHIEISKIVWNNKKEALASTEGCGYVD